MLRRLALMLASAALLVLPACHWIAGYDQAQAADAEDGGRADGETAPPPDDGAMDGVADGAWHDFSLDGVPRDGARDGAAVEGPPDALSQGEAAPPLDLPMAPDALQTLVPTEWARTLGSASFDEGRGVAVDRYDNVYAVGTLSGGANFGGTTLEATSADVVLASVNAEGSPRWAKHLGGIDGDHGYAVAVDRAGNVYVTGSIQGNVDFGGGEVQAKHQLDIFLASYTPTGAHRWSNIYGGLNADIGRALAVNAAGEVTLVGSINSAVSFGPNPVTYNGGGDAFVARFDGANGDHLWSKAFGGTSEDIAYGVATDSAGNTTIVGTHQRTFGFDNCSLPMTSGKRIFVSSVDNATVSCSWVRGFGNTTSLHTGSAIATDAAGNIYFAGGFKGDFDFNGSPVPCSTSGSVQYEKVIVGSYAPDGAERWAMCADSDSTAGRATGVAVDGAEVYATGYFAGTFNYESVDGVPKAKASTGGDDIFVARLHTSGTLLGVEPHGGSGDDKAAALAVGLQHQVLVAGTYHSTDWSFGGTLPPAPVGDLFFFSLVP